MHLVSIQPKNKYMALQALASARPAVQRRLDAFGRLLETDLDVAIDAQPSARLLVEHFNSDIAEAMQLPGGRVLGVEAVALPVLA